MPTVRVRGNSQVLTTKLEADISGFTKKMAGMVSTTTAATTQVSKRFAALDLDKKIKRNEKEMARVQAQAAHIADQMGSKSTFGKVQSQITNLGSSITDTFSKSGVLGVAALGAAVIAGAPMLGAAVTTALTAGLAGGALALGIKQAFKDKAVQDAFSPIKDTWNRIMKEFGKPFIQPLIAAGRLFNQTLKEIGPTVSGLAPMLAPLVTDFAAGIAAFVKNALPGFISMIKAGIPLLKTLAQFMGPLGAAFSDFGSSVSKSSGSANVALKDMLSVVLAVVIGAGRAIRWLSDRYVDWRSSLIRAVEQGKAAWSSIVGTFTSVKSKVDSVINGMKASFKSGVSSIVGTWKKLETGFKVPVNFAIDPVYKSIRGLWNNVVSRFGFGKQLPAIQKFSKGGVVKGTGRGDKYPALLEAGERVLSREQTKNLGDGEGFLDRLKNKAKGFIQGIAAPAVRPLVNAARGLVNQIPGSNGFGPVLRHGGHRSLDALMNWVEGQDKKVPSGGVGMGYKAMQAAIARVFPGLGMISGLRPGARTLSGNQSYHALGRAVDYPASKPLAEWFHRMFGSRAKEIITPYPQYNVRNGKPYTYTGAVWRQHNFAGGNAHNHFAMDSYSEIQPGWGTHFNGTGKPERLANTEVLKDLGVGKGITINGGLHLHGIQNVQQLRDELLAFSRRNGGRARLPSK